MMNDALCCQTALEREKVAMMLIKIVLCVVDIYLVDYGDGSDGGL